MFGNTISAMGYGNYSVTVQNTLNNCSNTSAPVNIVSNCGGSPGPGNPPGCGAPPAISFTVTEDCGAFTITPTMTGGIWSLLSSPNPNISYSVLAGDVVDGTTTAAGLFTFEYVRRNPLGSACEYYYYADVVVPYTADLRYAISCNQAGSNYTIDLYDHSTQYPAVTNITTRDYYITPSMTWIGNGMKATTTQASGSTVTYLQVIGDGGAHPPCSSYVTVTTPVFPTLLLADPGGPGCVKDVVFNFGYIATGATSYWWDFGDNSNNGGSQNPMKKVYMAPSLPTYIPTLTIKDDYGCSASASANIQVGRWRLFLM